MKKNIILKDNQENILIPINDSNNIMINNLKLKDYIDIKFNELKDIIYNNINFKLYTSYNDYTVVGTSGDYENITSISGTFNGRKNTDDNPFVLNNENLLTLNNNLQSEYIYTKVEFEAQFHANSSGGKYIKIDVIRDGSSATSNQKSITLANNENGSLYTSLVFYGKPGDIIKFQVFSATGDLVTKIASNIEVENRFQNNLNCLI